MAQTTTGTIASTTGTVNSSTTTVVGVAGATVVIPPGSLPFGTVVTEVKQSLAAIIAVAGPPPGNPASEAITLSFQSPSGNPLSCTPSCKVSVGYTPTGRPGVVPEMDVQGSWIALKTTYDPGTKTASSAVRTGGTFAVFEVPAAGAPVTSTNAPSKAPAQAPVQAPVQLPAALPRTGELPSSGGLPMEALALGALTLAGAGLALGRRLF